MCRFLAYLGQPILMADLIINPKNSLINQSVRAHESDEPLNGDGFGVGWYMPDIDPIPALFTSIQPAWNNRNLRYLAPITKSNCIFAHVRAASEDGSVNELNCHPFHSGNLLFMHNGDIEGFKEIRRTIQQGYSDLVFDKIHGNTDSEHLFGLFLDILYKSKKDNYTPEEMAQSLEEAIFQVQELKQKMKIKGIDYINAAITDGKTMVAIRYTSSSKEKAPTLYYSEGTAYECIDNECRMLGDKQDKAVLIVSEKLTAYKSDWHVIPQNHILTVDSNLTIDIRRCDKRLKNVKGK